MRYLNIPQLLILSLQIIFVIFSNPHALYASSSQDTTNVSMIFFIERGLTNTFDITSHPQFSDKSLTYTFRATSILPVGLDLSSLGIVSWAPDDQQFESLLKSSSAIAFIATSPNANAVRGNIRIVIKENSPPSMNASEPEKNTEAELVSLSEKNTSDSVEYEKIYLKLPDTEGWNTKNEGESFSFTLKASGGTGNYIYEILSPADLIANLDKYGNFQWKTGYDLVSKDEMNKAFNFKVRISDDNNNEAIDSLSLIVKHTNRPPIVSELPTFYIQFDKNSEYQLKKEGLIYDPDGDSIIFKPVLKELLQGMKLDKNGKLTWKPSVSQFHYLRKNPMVITFSVEELQNDTKTIGQIKIEASQEDLPPQLTMIPEQVKFDIKENEEIHINFFVTDPNGEDDILTFGFVSESSQLEEDALQKKGPSHYEFSWTPGFDFIKKANGSEEFSIKFYAIDKESNRMEKTLSVKVSDAENLAEKDRLLYEQYRTVLERSWDLVIQLEEKEKELEKKYKKARKGKKNRAITTASLGAVSGLTPIVIEGNGQKVVTGIGGTATATIGTLEASNVIGESPSDIMKNISLVSQKKNDIIIYGNIFAAKFALPLSRRDPSFQNELKTLTMQLNIKDLIQLELEAGWENPKKPTNENIKKIFKDFYPDSKYDEEK